MFTVSTSMLAATRDGATSQAPYSDAAGETVGPSLLLFVSLLVTLSALARVQRSSPRLFAIGFYMSLPVVSSIPVSFRLFWAPTNPPVQWQAPRTLLVAFLFSLLLNWFIQTTLGSSELRLRRQVEQTKRALDEVELQRSRLVETQEQVRNQIAEYLHDNLQTRLVVLGLQMRNFIGTLPKSRTAVANSLLEELERIRGIDVRSAARVLRPELEAISLATALQQLVETYGEAMKVNLHLDKATGSPWLPERLKLAAYRIVEQALLNAAAHGKASKVICTLRVDDGALEISIVNDGTPPPTNFDGGAGFAVIQSWVELYSGEWHLSARKVGAELKAKLRDDFLAS
jgi:two-component system, NarL family, sensor histidine kinase FusK